MNFADNVSLKHVGRGSAELIKVEPIRSRGQGLAMSSYQQNYAHCQQTL